MAIGIFAFLNACTPDAKSEQKSEAKSEAKPEESSVDRSAEEMGDLVLVEQGNGRASIVIPAEPSRMNKLAAEELQTFIQRLSGAELPIVTEPATDDGVNIFVGESEFTKKLGISAEGLESDSFVMRTGDNWLALVGDDTDYQPRELDALTVEDRARVWKEWDKRGSAPSIPTVWPNTIWKMHSLPCPTIIGGL